MISVRESDAIRQADRVRELVSEATTAGREMGIPSTLTSQWVSAEAIAATMVDLIGQQKWSDVCAISRARANHPAGKGR